MRNFINKPLYPTSPQECSKLNPLKREYEEKNEVIKVGSRIGDGAFGVVKEVTTRDGQPRAEKIQKIRDMYTAELKALCLSQVSDNNHIIGYVDYKYDGSKFYILMEKLDNRVSSFTRENISIEIVNQLASQISNALLHVSKAGRSHNDVKPDNVLFQKTQDGYRFVLADFGNATPKGQQHDTGTPFYMPPESPNIGYGHDAWSFGVLLHELIIGRKPIPTSLEGSAERSDDFIYRFLYNKDPHLRNSGLEFLQGRGFPFESLEELRKFMTYLDFLIPEETPWKDVPKVVPRYHLLVMDTYCYHIPTMFSLVPTMKMEDFREFIGYYDNRKDLSKQLKDFWENTSKFNELRSQLLDYARRNDIQIEILENIYGIVSFQFTHQPLLTPRTFKKVRKTLEWYIERFHLRRFRRPEFQNQPRYPSKGLVKATSV